MGVMAVSCSNDDDAITPASVSNLRAESTPGRIILRWDTPEDASSIHYIEVRYYDKLVKKQTMRTASIYADSCEIPDTRQKYGVYDFEVQSVSPSGDKGEIQTISMTSEPATATAVRTQINLTENDLSTNAPEPWEGSLAALIDGQWGTMFHTAWSYAQPGPHYLEVNLNQTFEVDDYFAFYYTPRSNPKDAPTDIDLLGSTDGNNWSLIRKFTQEADNLPTTYSQWTSENYKTPVAFNRIRYSVNQTKSDKTGPHGTGPCWALDEFKFYSVAVVDPEAPDPDDEL